MDFGQRIKELRMEKGWNQTNLANKLGVSQQVIAHYETGSKMPRPETLVKISKIFGVSSDFLLGIVSERGAVSEGISDKIVIDRVKKASPLLFDMDFKRPTLNGIPLSDEQLIRLSADLKEVYDRLARELQED